ncbi:MAG TPA: kelch repeat-containing protein [Thermoanaerobaculia bacterium]|nr:kelch repeat-containing protein [Thermoanaerobaculia bacterium]
MRPQSLKTFLALGALLSAAALQAATPPRWQKVRQHGDVPPPVWEAGVAFARTDGQPDTVYRFGGQRGAFPAEFTVKDFYALDLDTATWTRLTSPQTPSPRANPLLIPGPCAGCVSVLGGRGVFDGVDRTFSEMLTYRETSGRWARVPSESVGDPFAIRRSAGAIVEVPNANDPPQKTYYAFGGLGNTLFTPDGLRNDVALYDRETGWRIIKTFGTRPVPRAWTAGVYDPARNSILIFGGYRLTSEGGAFGPDTFENDLWSLSLDTLTWTRLHPQGPLPSPRDNPTLFFDTAHGWLVLFGGQGFDRVPNDLWYYSVAENRWTQVALPSTARVPRGRVGGTSFVRETRKAFELYIHSGARPEGGKTVLLNDLWKLTWPKH